MSKRNFISDMINRARDRKLMKELLKNLSFNHYNHSTKMRQVGLKGYEYEFSCSNSPDQLIVHSAKNKSQRFPCMRLPEVIEDFVEDEPTADYTFSIQMERCGPFFPPSSRVVSNYPSDDDGDGKNGQVDHKAEEFIPKFHDQLRKQEVHARSALMVQVQHPASSFHGFCK
ncbi:hypothetical protein ACJRO7_028001 [Eucalyptus globulus]|uniref:Uncharacterized protein n=1 Tax=Eucalyptus globulus TaxID=34317 RepID=A0ABD3K050_EUCGL